MLRLKVVSLSLCMLISGASQAIAFFHGSTRSSSKSTICISKGRIVIIPGRGTAPHGSTAFTILLWRIFCSFELRIQVLTKARDGTDILKHTHKGTGQIVVAVGSVCWRRRNHHEVFRITVHRLLSIRQHSFRRRSGRI